MPDDQPEIPQETFIIAPVAPKGKALPGLQEVLVASEVLKLLKSLPAKTPGVVDLKKGAIALAKAGGEKLAKAK